MQNLIRKPSKKTVVLVVGAVTLLLIAASLLYVFVFQKKELSEVSRVKQAVARHYLLPTDEEPALLTVIDKSKLSSAFLKEKSENGDRVLVYQNNQRVIIYRPSIDRIIDVGPVVIDDPSS